MGKHHLSVTKTESVYTPCESQHKTGSKPGGRAGGGGVAGRARAGRRPAKVQTQQSRARANERTAGQGGRGPRAQAL